MADTIIGALPEATPADVATDETWLELENTTKGVSQKVKPSTIVAGVGLPPPPHGATHAPGGADPIPPAPPILWMGGDLTLTPEHHGQAIYIAGPTTVYVPGSLPEGTTVALIRGEGPIGPVPIQPDPSDSAFIRKPSGFERALASEAGAIACIYMAGTFGFPIEPEATIFGNLEPEPAP